MSPDSFLLTTFSLLLFWKKLFNCFSPCKFRCNSIICNLYYSYWLFISVFLIVLIYLYHMWLIFYISECMYCHTCLKPAVWPLAPSRWFISPNHLHLTLAVKVIWSAQKIVKNAFLHAAPARRSHAFVFVSVYECVIRLSSHTTGPISVLSLWTFMTLCGTFGWKIFFIDCCHSLQTPHSSGTGC